MEYTYLNIYFTITLDTDTKLCQGKDIFERMNYLYQVIIFLDSFLYSTIVITNINRLKQISIQASHLMALKNRVAASYYGNTMIGCAKKSVLRM